MDRNFKVRVSVAWAMLAVVLLSLYTFNGIPFKVLCVLFGLISILELLSFFEKKFTILNGVLAIIEIIFIIIGTYYLTQIGLLRFWYILLGVPGYDTIAYLSGKLFGGKIFKKSRPFPHISKNKTWEGTIVGVLVSVGMVAALIFTIGDIQTDFIFLFGGIFALMGDLFESYLKRKFGVKDSNEILIKNKFFKNLELVVGGSEGHGGFLDRYDSIAFACTILFILSIII